MKNEKWGLFKQYLHNELGITKEDIQQWVKESVAEEARNMVDRNQLDVNKVIRTIAMDKNYYGNESFKKEVIEKIAKELTSKISLKI